MNSAPPPPPPHHPAQAHNTRRPFAAHGFVLLGTIPLAITSWFISLISQAIVTSRIGNAFVGPLWFAIVLQTILIPWVIISILTSSIHLYHPTLSTLSALVVVFAVLGVDRNVFNPLIPAQQALSAGWILAAIVHMVWVLYFTSSEATPVGRALGVQGGYGYGDGGADHITYNGTGKPSAPAHSVQSVPTNVDAFTYPPAPHSTASAVTSGAGAGAGAGAPRTHSAALSTDPRAVSSAGTGGTGQEGDQRTTLSEFAAASAGGVLSPTTEYGTQGHSGVHGSATGGEGGHVPPATGAAAPDGITAEAQPEFLYKAEAVYPYDAKEPNELTFYKGDILDIADKNTKWWDARRSDGSRGLAPSNYLRLL